MVRIRVYLIVDVVVSVKQVRLFVVVQTQVVAAYVKQVRYFAVVRIQMAVCVKQIRRFAVVRIQMAAYVKQVRHFVEIQAQVAVCASLIQTRVCWVDEVVAAVRIQSSEIAQAWVHVTV